MRIALIADLHGNRPATDALERDLDRHTPGQALLSGRYCG